MYSRKRTQSARDYPKRRKTTQTTYQKTQSIYRPRSFTQGEWKYLDTTINVAVDQVGSFTLLNGLVPGSGASQRIGQKVSIMTMEFRLNSRCTPGTGIDQVHRLLFLLDRQANGAAPAALTDFLNAGNYQGLRQLNNRRRFKVLKDYYFNVNATGEAGSQRVIYKYMKFRRPIVVEYNAGIAGTIADIVSNAMYFIPIGQIAAGATAGSVVGYVRLRYTDM